MKRHRRTFAAGLAALALGWSLPSRAAEPAGASGGRGVEALEAKIAQGASTKQQP